MISLLYRNIFFFWALLAFWESGGIHEIAQHSITQFVKGISSQMWNECKDKVLKNNILVYVTTLLFDSGDLSNYLRIVYSSQHMYLFKWLLIFCSFLAKYHLLTTILTVETKIPASFKYEWIRMSWMVYEGGSVHYHLCKNQSNESKNILINIIIFTKICFVFNRLVVWTRWILTSDWKLKGREKLSWYVGF